ncbi:hypothetical protein TNCV_3219301, partial [Trichonephila clavipes]
MIHEALPLTQKVRASRYSGSLKDPQDPKITQNNGHSCGGMDGFAALGYCTSLHSPICQQLLASKNITEMERPPYSSDLAPWNFFSIPTVKSCLKRTHFTSVEVFQ